MFKKSRRLSRSDFPEALRRGRRASSAHFSVVLPAKGLTGYAIVVPKKGLRLSAARHRLRRRVVHALASLPLPPALIVYPAPAVLKLPPAHLKEELAGLLLKIGRRA